MRRRNVMAVTLLLSAVGIAVAQQSAPPYPARPVRIIVPFAAGGPIDVIVRAVGEKLSAKWGQPVIVENKPGAGGLIGAQAVATSKADGEVLLGTMDSVMTINRYLYRSLPYDPDTSFEPIIQLTRNFNFIVATAAFPAADLKELVTYARQRPKDVSYGTWGTGSHPDLIFKTLAAREQLGMVAIPYKGAAPSTQAMLASEVPLGLGTVALLDSFVKAGKLKMLAYTGPERSTQYPDVPTTAELGYPYLRSPISMALFAPSGTPRAIVSKINGDVQALLDDPAFADPVILSRGQNVAGGSPESLRKAIREDTLLIGEQIRAAGIKPE